MTSEKILLQTEAHYRGSLERVFPKTVDFSKLARELLSEQKASEELTRLSQTIDAGLSGKKILEIGSGYGMVLVTARKKFNADMYGLEPGEQFQGAFSVCQDLLTEQGLSPDVVKKGVGEKIPFEDNVFDIVYSSNVLEHVQDPPKVLAEAVRVLKPGGVMVCVVPNYGSWWEGHYGFFFPPHSPRIVLKSIAVLLGRDPSFIDTLQLVTMGKLRQWLKPLGDHIEVKDVGQDLWEKRVRTLDIAEWSFMAKIKRVVRIINRLRLTDLVIMLGRALHWETPFVLVVVKK
jgi:ubiquinone/menaquinone biosynthesis C-methylase UbiE